MRARMQLNAVLLAVAVPVAAQGGGRIRAIEPEAGQADGLPYFVFEPTGLSAGRLYPLVLALHGNGQRPFGHVKQMSALSSSELPVFVVAPALQQTVRRYAPLKPDLDRRLPALVERLCASYPIDRGRIFLEGYSQGGHVASRWSTLWRAKGATFPFREVWLDAGGDPPRRDPAPVPHVIVVGAKDTALWNRYNYVAMCRRLYQAMFVRGTDVDYIEVPDHDHAIESTAVGLLRPRLQQVPDHESALPRRSSWPDALQPAIAAFCAGKFGDAFAGLQAATTATPDDRKLAAAAKRLREAFRKHIKRLSSHLAAKSRGHGAELSDLLLAHRWAAALAGEPDLAKLLQGKVESLEKKRHLALEVEAWRAFEAARALARDNGLSAANERLRPLTEGKLARTVFGQRAARHLQACEPPPPGATGGGERHDGG